MSKLFSTILLIPTLMISTAAANDRDQIESGPFVIETVAEGLAFPWSLAFLPDGSMLVTEREGRIRIIKDGALQPEPVRGTPEAYVKSQGGYFDIVLHPDYSQNKIVYLSYAHGKSNANATRVVRAIFDGEALENLEVLYEVRPTKDTPAHYGGRMAFLPDGTLLLTTGDGFEYREKAQLLNSALGKIIRINEDGSIPDNNPFTNKKGALPEIWTYGHRNPQGLIFDSQTGTTYMHEHGPKGGDEINIVEPGSNYGWPIATYGIDYSGAQISPFTEYEGTVQPIKYWVPSIAPSGFAIYRGEMFSEWDGDLLVGALAGRALHRVDMENGTVVGEEILLKDLGERIRDVRIGPDGAIYVTTDSENGRVLRLTPQK